MKITLDAGPFRDAVTWAARGLPNRSTTQMQVLGGMLIEAAENGTVTLSVFDYETSRRATVPGRVHTPGRVLVGGRILAAVVDETAGDHVDLTVDGTKLAVSCGSLEARLPTMADGDYPRLPALPAPVGAVQADALADTVARVACAAGKDDTLPVLTAVLLQATAGQPLRLAATDRYRLAVADLPWDCQLDQADPATVLVPAATLADAAKTAVGTVTVHAGTGASGEGLFGLAWADRWTTTRLVDGAFPPYEKFMIDNDKLAGSIHVDRDGLLAALKRVKPAAAKTSPLGIEVADWRMRLTQNSGQGEEITDSLGAECDLPEVTFHVNPAYLRDALTATSGPVVHVGHVDYGRPIRITGDDPDSYTHILMPIKVSS